MPIKPVDLALLNKKAKNVHEAIVAMSKRARQVNEDIKIEFNQRIELLTPKTETETDEVEVNPDQLRVSLEFEKRPKPTDTSLTELVGGKLEWRYNEPEPPPPAKELPAGDEEEE
jgi:hypothetical protein